MLAVLRDPLAAWVISYVALFKDLPPMFRHEERFGLNRIFRLPNGSIPGDLLKTLHVMADHPSIVDVTCIAWASQARTFLRLLRKDPIQRVLKEAAISDDSYFHPQAEGWVISFS